MLRKQTQKPDIPHLLKAELTEKFFQLRQGETRGQLRILSEQRNLL